MNRKRKQSRQILAAVLTVILSMSGCGGAGASADKRFLAGTGKAVEQAQEILMETAAMADEMSGACSILYEQMQTDDSAVDSFVERCRESLEKQEQNIEAFQNLKKEAEQVSAKSETGQAVQDAREEYFSDGLAVMEDMKKTLEFYIAQNDAFQPLMGAMATDNSEIQQYLQTVYDSARQVKTELLALETPSYLSDVWPHYVGSMDLLLKYMESQSQGLAYSDVLRLYSANQLISRMGLEAAQYEETIFDLMSWEFTHSAEVAENSVKRLGEEILSDCRQGTVQENGYQTESPVVYVHKSVVDEIHPNLYPSMDSVANLLLYTDKGISSVMVRAEIDGFSQVYEQKVTLSEEMTYLMIKPPVLSDMPDLSSGRDTQLTISVTDTATGDVIEQETKNLKIYSIYDYKTSSDEFGIIQNDNILAWMTPETDGVLAVRRNAISWLESNFGSQYGILPGYQYAYGFGEGEEQYVTYYQVAAIQSAISNMGVRYNMGAYSFNATQRVLMPDAVLQSGSGICIETAVLMASVLESAGMHAMIVLTPGHAQTAVETWSGSGQYFLIETTCLPFTATEDGLNSLITPLDNQGWADYLSNAEQRAQQSGGMVYIVDCDLATTLDIKGLAYGNARLQADTSGTNQTPADGGQTTPGTDNGTGNGSGNGSGGTPTAQGSAYTLTHYDGGFFSMDLPSGWKLETVGQYAGFGYRAYDPSNPDIQIFYFGELGPYFRSEAGRQKYISTGMDGRLALLPVLDPASVSSAVNAMSSYAQAYTTIQGETFNFPAIQSFSLSEEKQITTALSSLAVYESVISGTLISGSGASCRGIIQGSVVDMGSYEIDGVDAMPTMALSNVYGVIAPEETFEAVAPTLLQSLASFAFTEEYIQEAMNASNAIAQSAQEYSRQNSAMMEEITREFSEYIRQ